MPPAAPARGSACAVRRRGAAARPAEATGGLQRRAAEAGGRGGRDGRGKGCAEAGCSGGGGAEADAGCRPRPRPRAETWRLPAPSCMARRRWRPRRHPRRATPRPRRGRRRVAGWVASSKRILYSTLLLSHRHDGGLAVAILRTTHFTTHPGILPTTCDHVVHLRDEHSAPLRPRLHVNAEDVRLTMRVCAYKNTRSCVRGKEHACACAQVPGQTLAIVSVVTLRSRACERFSRQTFVVSLESIPTIESGLVTA